MSSVVTANLLRSGDVVYLGAGASWVRLIQDAQVANNKDELEKLESIAEQASDAQLVISVYPMDVAIVDGKPSPRSVREVIRAAHGPTV